MIRRRHLVLAALAGAAVPVLFLFICILLAPNDSNELSPVIEVAVADTLGRAGFHSQSIVYLRTDLGQEIPASLRSRYPALQLRPWKERPEDHGCEPHDGLIPMGACLRGDFVSANLLSFPLWRTALVAVGVHNGGAELWLIKIGGRWRIVSERWSVT